MIPASIVSRISAVTGADLQGRDRTLLWLLPVAFVSTLLFSYGEAEAVLYVAVVLSGVVYVVRRPAEGIWVTFLLLAITCLLYPVTMDDAGLPAEKAFRPYNLAIVSMAAAMMLGILARRRRLPKAVLRTRSGLANWILALAAVFCLATAYGQLSPARAGAVYVLQQSSAWLTFFLFLWIGHQLWFTPDEVRRAIARLHLAVLVYAIVFLIKFLYLAYGAGGSAVAAGNFGYAQRIVLFFAGVVAVLATAERFAPESASAARSTWISLSIFLPAVLLSGSRGILGAVLLGGAFFVLVCRVRVVVAVALLALIPLLLSAVFVLGARSALFQEYVVARFLVTPEQDASYMGRISELQATAEAVRRNPVLGNGTLASYMYFDPLFGWRETAFVDNGLGYLLMKTGLLGTGVFVLLVSRWLGLLWRLRKAMAAEALIPLVVLVFYLAFLPFGAGFFDVRYSWLIGIMGGYTMCLIRTLPRSPRRRAPETLLGANGVPA